MRWFRRYRAQLLGATVVLLMLSWGLTGFLQRSVRQMGDAWGHVHGQAITRADMREAESVAKVGLLLQLVDGDVRRFLFGDGGGLTNKATWRCVVLMKEAEVQGIKATDAEAAGLIATAPALRGADGFSPELYGRFLRATRLSETQVRRALAWLVRISKLVALRRDGVLVARPETWMLYRYAMAQVKARVVSVDAKLFVPLVETPPEEVRRFYEERRDVVADAQNGVIGYKAPPRVQVEYARARLDVLEKQVAVSDDEVAQYYKENRELYRQEPAKAPGGGDKAQEAPEEARYASLDDVREEIRRTLAGRKAREEAGKLVRAVMAELDAVEDDYSNEPLPLGQMARRHGLDYQVATVAGGRQFLSVAELSEVVPDGSEVAEFAFREDSQYFPRAFGLKGGEPVVCQVLATRPSQPEPYEDVAEQVRLDYARGQALELATKFAETLKARVIAEGFAAALSEMEGRLRSLTKASAVQEEPLLLVEESGLFSRNAPQVPGVAAAGRAVVEEAFRLAPGDVAVAVEGPPVYRCHVVELTERREAPADDFAQMGRAYTYFSLGSKQRLAVQDWLQGLLDAAQPTKRIEE